MKALGNAFGLLRAYWGMRRDRNTHTIRRIIKRYGCTCGRMVRGYPAARRRRKFERCSGCDRYVSVHGRAGDAFPPRPPL